LDDITFDPKEGLKIGATALLADVATHPDILKHYPAVAAAALETANVQIRNMGTVAGNLCNAAPSADNAPTLLAMNAEVVITGADGERTAAPGSVFQGARIKRSGTRRNNDRHSRSRTRCGSGVSYQHISARGKVDISAVCVGVMVHMAENGCKDVRIFLGAVAPVPMRAVKAEALCGTSADRRDH
jgi:CO/xanthine dehydrogenase FAD-binding subunit